MAHFTIQDVIQLEIITHLRLVIKLELAIQHLGVGEVTLDGLWDVVDILRLDEGLEVIFEHLCEIILKLRAPEVLEDFCPVRGVLHNRI